jgi:hypothetical protein
MGSMFQYRWMTNMLICNKCFMPFFAIGVYISIIHGKAFEKGMKIHIMSRVKVCSSTTYHILLAKLGELPI